MKQKSHEKQMEEKKRSRKVDINNLKGKTGNLFGVLFEMFKLFLAQTPVSSPKILQLRSHILSTCLCSPACLYLCVTLSVHIGFYRLKQCVTEY